MLYKLTSSIVKIATEIMCRIDAPDLQNMPSKGPLIAITNHTGQLEVSVFFGQLVPRPMTAWAKSESWDNPFLRWIFNIWGLIPIRRGEADISALKLAVKALNDGFIFGVAPEGTRNITGRLKRAHPGIVMLAAQSKAPIIPVAHWGGEDFLKNLPRFKRTDFHVRLGKPFRLNLDGVKMSHEVRQQIADEMMARLAELIPQEYRGEYENAAFGEKVYTKTI